MDNIYTNIIEALIFSSDEPLKHSEIVKAIKGIDGEDISITDSDIEESVNRINEKYSESNNSFSITRLANGFTFGTRPEFAKYLGYLSSEKSKRRLSQAALETLAIIAYKQPVTKPELEAIRGVNCDYILNTLLEKRLISIMGRAETIGRPLLYGTTEEFLIYFGLNRITDLPKPREIEEIMQDEDFLEQKRKLMMSEIESSIEAETEESDKNDSIE
jgi:segregation and condensation protein B